MENLAAFGDWMLRKNPPTFRCFLQSSIRGTDVRLFGFEIRSDRGQTGRKSHNWIAGIHTKGIKWGHGNRIIALGDDLLCCCLVIDSIACLFNNTLADKATKLAHARQAARELKRTPVESRGTPLTSKANKACRPD